MAPPRSRVICGLLKALIPALLTVGTVRADVVFTVSNSADSGPGSLRQAILDANDSPGMDTIQFRIPGNGAHSLNLQAALPQVVDPVEIDGTTQPGYAGMPLIELNGSNAPAGAHGLLLLAGGCTIRGLVINRFPGDGIHIEGAGAILSRAISWELISPAKFLEEISRAACRFLALREI
jgi:hypothetical protein